MTNDPIRRNASTPTAGGIRGVTKGGLAGLAAVFVFGKTGSPELAAAASAIVSGLLAYVGKLIRNRGYDAPLPVQTTGELF